VATGINRDVFVVDADLDGDGAPDLVTGGVWYANPGTVSGTWTPHTIGGGFGNVALAYDFDGDGDVDLLGTAGTGSAANSNLRWARNDGAGNFTVLTNLQPGTGDFLQGVDIIIDNGRPAVVLSWHDDFGNGNQILSVPADPTTETWTVSPLSSFTDNEAVDIGDIDGDGTLDIATGTAWLSGAGGSWNPNPIFSPGGGTIITGTFVPDRVKLADVDGDGDLDEVVAYERWQDLTNPNRIWTVDWYENDGSGGGWIRHVAGTMVGGHSLDVGDVDGDGRLDIVVGEHALANPAEGRVVALLNLGAGLSWQTWELDRGMEHHDGTRLADLDGDGDLDVYSIGWNAGRLTVLENPTSSASPLRLDVTVAAGGVDRQSWVSETAVPVGTDLAGTIDVVDLDHPGRQVPWQLDPSGPTTGTLLIFHPFLASGDTARYQVLVGTGPSAVPPMITAETASDEGSPAYLISTPVSDWYIQTSNGGVSSLVDADGNDWVGYGPATGALGEFRGIGNAVHPDGVLHPGFNVAATSLDRRGPLRAVVEVLSFDGKWRGRWSIDPAGARFEMVEAPAGVTWWFLYEGVPGGEIDSDQLLWPGSPPEDISTADHVADIAGEWAAVADLADGRSIFVAADSEDSLSDRFYLMDSAMTVLGFGRGLGTDSLLEGPRTFRVGLVPATDEATVLAAVQSARGF